MQALNNLGRKPPGKSFSELTPAQQAEKLAEVWRSILVHCAMGDTLVLDFSVATTGDVPSATKSTKIAACSGAVTAVVDRSKRAPKIMFRAEGFREQIQLPPAPSAGGNAAGGVGVAALNPNNGLRGADTASLVEFLSTSKLVGAAVLRKERGSSSQKAVVCVGTRSKVSNATKIESEAKKPTEQPANLVATVGTKPDEPLDLTMPAAVFASHLPEAKVEMVKPEPVDDDDQSYPDTHPHFLLTTDQKRSQLPALLERLYVDEPTATHVGAGLLLSLIGASATSTCQESDFSAGIGAGSFFVTSRFHDEYVSNSVCGDGKSRRSSGTHAITPFDEPNPQTHWEAVGSGAFATVYKVAGTRTYEEEDADVTESFSQPSTSAAAAPVAVKVVRGLLHSGEEHTDDTQLGLFQKIVSEVRTGVAADHISTCPHVVKALNLPSKAATGLAQYTLDAVRKGVGMGAVKSKAQKQLLADGMGGTIMYSDVNMSAFHDQIRPGHMSHEEAWYDKRLGVVEGAASVSSSNTIGVEVIDVEQMEHEADGHGITAGGAAGTATGGKKNKNGPRSAPQPRLSFLPFGAEIEALLEWKELMQSELRRGDGHVVPERKRKGADDDEASLEKRLRRAHDQHGYSILVGSRATVKQRHTELLPTGIAKQPVKTKVSSQINVADMFMRRKQVDAQSSCVMTGQRPHVSPCRSGFSSGAMGIRQSVVGELINLQICAGNDQIVPLLDWGYRCPRLASFLQLALSFMIEMFEHTHVGKRDLLDRPSLSVVEAMFGGSTAPPAITTSVPLTMQSPSLITSLSVRQLGLTMGVSGSLPSKNMPFSPQEPLYPSMEHLLACSQAHLTYFGAPSLLEGCVGIVTPFSGQPMHRLHRKVPDVVTERKGIADVVESEIRERLNVLRRMKDYLGARAEHDDDVNRMGPGISYLPMGGSSAASFVEPTFDNPFGYSLHDDNTRVLLDKLPQLESYIDALRNTTCGAPPCRPRFLPGGLVVGLAPVTSAFESQKAPPAEESIAKFLLPHRLSDRRERLAFTLGVLRDIVPALYELHVREVVHRDIKPNNIMVTRGRTFILPLEEAQGNSFGSSAATPGKLCPVELFDFLGRPTNLLKRTRCSFHLIDLGWGRVLPSATITIPPLPSLIGAKSHLKADDDRDGDEGTSGDSEEDLDDWEQYALNNERRSKRKRREAKGRYQRDEVGGGSLFNKHLFKEINPMIAAGLLTTPAPIVSTPLTFEALTAEAQAPPPSSTLTGANIALSSMLRRRAAAGVADTSEANPLQSWMDAQETTRFTTGFKRPRGEGEEEAVEVGGALPLLPFSGATLPSGPLPALKQTLPIAASGLAFPPGMPPPLPPGLTPAQLGLPVPPAAKPNFADPRLYSMQRKAPVAPDTPVMELAATGAPQILPSATSASALREALVGKGLGPLTFSDLEKGGPSPAGLFGGITAPIAQNPHLPQLPPLAMANNAYRHPGLPPLAPLVFREADLNDLAVQNDSRRSTADNVSETAPVIEVTVASSAGNELVNVKTRDFLMSGPAGNMCYRAPEFMVGPHASVVLPGLCGPDGSRYPYTGAIDVFALGTVLFELVTGTRVLKVRPQELGQSDLRNGHLLQRMVESLGYPKVWVAEVVASMRGVSKVSELPHLILSSPYASTRIASASAQRVAQRCIEQLEGFFAADGIRKHRILDAPSHDAAIAYAWDEVVNGTTNASKMLSMTDTSGSNGAECFYDPDTNIFTSGAKEKETSTRLKPYAIIPVRLLGQHGLIGLVMSSARAVPQGGRTVLPSANLFNRTAPLPVVAALKRPSTSACVIKHINNHSMRSAWAYEPTSLGGLGHKGLLEVEDDRRAEELKALGEDASQAPTEVRGTFTATPVPNDNEPSTITECDTILELVGLITRMLAWEPSERPTLREVYESGCFQLLCGGDRGQYDV